MRVLFLATDAYGGHGGIALCNRELISALSLHPDCSEVVVLPRVITREIGPVPDGVTFVAASADGKLAYLRELMRWRNYGPYDVVICGHMNLLPVTRLITPDPILMTHGIEAWKPPRSPLASQRVHNCRAIISVSQFTRDRLREWSRYAGPMHVLPNTIRAEKYGMRDRRPDLVERFGLAGHRVLLTVGRLVASERYKGFDEVIQVLTDLPPDVAYLIAGGGDDEQRLRNKAEEAGVADRVRFTGNFSEADKADIYALADVYVMPSRGEGFGFVFLEALASGLPAIASKHDGGREALLGGELGLLVDPASPAEIRTAIEEQLMRPRHIPSGLSHFSFDNFVMRTHAIIHATR